MTTNAHILVCDDELDLREMVGKYLAKKQFKVTLAANGAELDECMQEHDDISLIILDINMPGEDGLSVLRRLQSNNELSVIMLTAADESVDRVIGLELGADDYVGKPVDLRELEARIKAVLRRSGSSTADVHAEDLDNAESIMIDGMRLDLAGAKLYGRDEAEIPLTAMEFNLLTLFLRNKGRVLNRDQLMEMSSDREWDPFDRSIDIRVLRLRRKLEVNPSKPTIIRTVRGMGYIFDPAGKQREI
ncbi:MAG: response regulator [Granulosicoccus sp.]|nr:response regulator [Granulosicoccus sp.]